METTFEISALDLIEKGMGLVACTAGCVYGAALLYPELPLKVLEQASLYAALGLTAIALTPRTYCWIDSHIQDLFDKAAQKVQQYIEDHPLISFAAAASVCALGCLAITNPSLALTTVSLATHYFAS